MIYIFSSNPEALLRALLFLTNIRTKVNSNPTVELNSVAYIDF